MATAYLPRSQLDASAWMQCFANGIIADPGRFGLSSDDATTIQAAVAPFVAATKIAAAAGTRTSVSISARNSARDAAEAVCRTYYSRIKINDAISSADKVSIGVRPLNRSRSKAQPALDEPSITITGGHFRYQTLKITASHSRYDRGKLPGAAFVELVVALDNDISFDPTTARTVGLFTRTRIQVDFNPTDNGKHATYFARWVSRKGDKGPWSMAAGMTVAA